MVYGLEEKEEFPKEGEISMEGQKGDWNQRIMFRGKLKKEILKGVWGEITNT